MDCFWQKIIGSLMREKRQFLTKWETGNIDEKELDPKCIFIDSLFSFRRKLLTRVYYTRHLNVFLEWITKLFKVSLLKSPTICLQERRWAYETMNFWLGQIKLNKWLDICLKIFMINVKTFSPTFLFFFFLIVVLSISSKKM